MAHPQVSVIMPLYNKAPYVKKGVESVLTQSYKDFELIVVDDGSTDDSGLAADDLLKGKNNCYVIHQQNAGVSAARNRGIAESKGQYIAFLDADDWWNSNYLEEMVKFAEQYPDAGLWASNYIYYKPGKTRVGVKQVYGVECMAYSKEGWSGYINYPRSYYENGEQVVWTGAVMLRRSILEKPEIRNEKGEIFSTGIKLGEDFLLWLRLSLSYPVAFLNKPLAYYNNDIPASLRLTKHLHAPEKHMLWHMDSILDSYSPSVVVDVVVVVNIEDWKKLFSKLRVTGLYPYWLSKEYHEMAKQELQKVDWTIHNDWNETNQYQMIYTLPLWMLQLRQIVYSVGSCAKSLLRKR